MRAYKRENPLGRLPEGVSKSGELVLAWLRSIV